MCYCNVFLFFFFTDCTNSVFPNMSSQRHLWVEQRQSEKEAVHAKIQGLLSRRNRFSSVYGK